ncbi:hypothetical protein [Marivita hallyeonensis]|uniref:Uncharacterized protein n=1 Tax=Marivita hallyeonensis TaxID=996342 RepID=A0A1M5WW07_9RHOB|nr:hypothetical protein [Marivita hallyeonensis]SHH91324.1 hypothetical protein SAMN05443551_3535 [Marivita hallyeonensis]
MPLILWFIVAFAALNAVWHLFALSGVMLMAPSETVGTISETGAFGVKLRSAIAAVLYAGLAYWAYKRSRLAIVACLLIIPVKLIGWFMAGQMSDALPAMPAAMLGIWVMYRVLALAVLLAAAGYLWRLLDKGRLNGRA